MRFSTVSAIAIAIGVMPIAPAFGQPSSRTSSIYPGPGNASRMQEGPDHDFAMTAAVFAKFSVVAGRLATMEAQDARLRELAELMAKDYAAALGRLRTAAGNADITLPAAIGPNEIYQTRIAAVRNRKGAAFDRAYCLEQVEALREAEAMLRSYAATGGNGQLRLWATRTISLVQQHERSLQQILTSGDDSS
ncbi:putative membrane protein [Rhodospirillales bacterium URHD0017]|nr:putative membrane protein [Rhodospirillales bacterium URHD0017]